MGLCGYTHCSNPCRNYHMDTLNSIVDILRQMGVEDIESYELTAAEKPSDAACAAMRAGMKSRVIQNANARSASAIAASKRATL